MTEIFTTDDEQEIIIDHPKAEDVYVLKLIWKSTFGDSDYYVDMIFENYFDEKYWLCAKSGENIVASLTGILYDFRSDRGIFKGLYLCGLSTLKQYRRRGIMERMIKHIESECIGEGIKLTFLIPADLKLRKYYAKLGYSDSKPRTRNILANLQGDISDCRAKRFLVMNYELLQRYNEDLFDYSVAEIMKYEASSTDGASLLHSASDWKNLISEKLRDGGVFVEGVIFVGIRGLASVLVDKSGEYWKLYGDDATAFGLVIELILRNPQLGNPLLINTTGKYGMVKFLESDSAEKGAKSKGSKIRIFESDCSIRCENGKMNSERNSGISENDADILNGLRPSDISFRLMLD